MQYWTAFHERKIIDFQKASSIEERNNIYLDHLHSIVKQWCEIILKTQFIKRNKSLIDYSDEMINGAIAKAYTSIDRFDSSTGKKAFSYLQAAIKNYYLDYLYKLNSVNSKGQVTVSTSDGDYDDILTESNESNKYDVDTESAVKLILDYLSTLESNSVHIIDLTTCLEKYRSINKYFITYYLTAIRNQPFYKVKNLFWKHNLTPLLYHNANLLQFYKDLFKKYDVPNDQIKNCKYLLTVFDRYEFDKRNKNEKKRKG